ncbi:DUF1254 domain-containing protein [Stenotrophomonas bentonitica]|uniref:DUF1254 domain-containing protein n=1 Tax=Stenotrophomonas bentonitica TaxID=1450134 RepID=UPI00345E37B4
MLQRCKLTVLIGLILMSTQAFAQKEVSNDWIEDAHLKSRYGELDFKGGYPSAESAQRLREALFVNRAVEVYLAQMPTVSWYSVWKGTQQAGQAKPNQLVIWESLMDAQTLLLTGNTETVYGLAAVDLRNGPVVIEVPPKMLGGVSDIRQAEIIGIGPGGMDKGQGGKVLLLPPGYEGTVPQGYLVGHSPSYRAVFGVRGFQVDGSTAPAVALMKQTRIYPLSAAANPPAQAFFNGSGQRVDTLFPDNIAFFDELGRLVQDEPKAIFTDPDRFAMANVGLVSGQPFQPDAAQKKLLAEAAQLGGAYARVNGFDSRDPARLVYPDRKWEWTFIGGSATWDAQGYVNSDRRAAFAYSAIGMSPAMASKAVGVGSQYIWTMRDADGAYLDGGRDYHLRIPANVPVKDFWSVVVYDAQTRSLLRTGQKFPSISQYSGPVVNADGSVDIWFGPVAPAGKEKNWVQTVPGKGWFTIMRFYGPLGPFFDKTWRPEDIARR